MGIRQLKKRCDQPIHDFHELGKFKACEFMSGYTFIDRKSDVLGIAHLDTVLPSTHFVVQPERIYNPCLDDRLGVYTLLDYLPSQGLKFDVLLTENEEIGRSTASYFEPPKQYNWMFQFDRFGQTTVLYEYETPALVSMLREENFKVGVGSFSDICFLDHLGITGFNFATGYYKEHCKDSYMIRSEWKKSVNTFISFFNKYKHTQFKYDVQDFSLWDMSLETDIDYCPLCGQLFTDFDNLECLYDENLCLDCVGFVNKWSK